jgi:MerR family copper efflux transcriptional regulator
VNVAALSIGELARRAGVNVQTVRFYEREGLLPRPPRTASGYRAFPGDAVGRVRFIRRAKGLGFSLREISDLLHVRTHPETACADARRRADAKIADIDARIRTLRAMRSELAVLSKACAGTKRHQCCPLLRRLESEPGAKQQEG